MNEGLNKKEVKEDSQKNMEEINQESDERCIGYHVKEELENIYKKYPYLFNKWIEIDTETWEGSMPDENGKEVDKNDLARNSSKLCYIEEPPQSIKFDESDLFDAGNDVKSVDYLDKSILEKNKDKLFIEAIPKEYFETVQYYQSTSHWGLDFLALRGKLFKWNKNTTLGNLLEKLEEKQ